MHETRLVAVAQYEETKKQQKPGEQAQPELATQRADVVSRDQTLAQAASQLGQTANRLKRLLSRSAMDPLWRSGLAPSDLPELGPPPIGVEEAVKRAIESRPYLEQLRLQVGQSQADVRFARQETKPAVNLRVEFLSTGSAGRVYAISPDGVLSSDTADPASPLYGGLAKSAGQAFRGTHPSVAAGLDVELPLGNGAAKAHLASAVLGERKLNAQIRIAEEDIMLEVRNAWEPLPALRKALEAAIVSRKHAEGKRTAEAAKAEGETRSLELMRIQRDLGEAASHEMQAFVDYRLAEMSPPIPS